jgi:hypothetical protein
MASAYLVATFAEPRALLEAVTAIRAAGFKIYDVYAPCPVHGLDEAMGIRRSRLPYVTLAAGAIALVATVAFEFYAAVFDWTLNVGGKPDNSTLAFVPICFELSVLFGGLGSVAALLLRARLYPGKKTWLVNPGITDDVFAVVLRRPSDDETHQRALTLLKECGAASVTESEAEL